MLWGLSLIHIFIDGAIFPTEIRTATLISELEPLKNVLENPIIDKRLFNMEKGDAYMELYDLTFPENDADHNYGYHLTPASLSEDHCHVFCVSDGLKTRVSVSYTHLYVYKRQVIF